MENIFLGSSVGPGVYSLPHIVYLAIMIPLVVAGIILVMKFIKEEKHIRLLVMITAGALLALIVTNRIAYTYQRVVIEGGTLFVDGEVLHYTWGYLVPETFCGLSALALSLAALCFKKDNILLHALAYFGLINGIASSFYPVYLNRQGFFEVGTITSLIFHVVMVFLSLVIILKKYMVPTIKKWYAVPLVYAIFCLIGLFDVQVLGTPEKEAMSLFEPLVSQLPHLSMWYSIGIALTVADIIFLFLHEIFANHKNFQVVLYEMLFLDPQTIGVKKVAKPVKAEVKAVEKVAKKPVKEETKPVVKASKPVKVKASKKKPIEKKVATKAKPAKKKSNVAKASKKPASKKKKK